MPLIRSIVGRNTNNPCDGIAIIEKNAENTDDDTAEENRAVKERTVKSVLGCAEFVVTLRN